MKKFRNKKYFYEDNVYSNDNDFDYAVSQKTQFMTLKKQVKLLQSEVKTLKKLSVMNIFGTKANLKKFYQDIW